MQTIDLRSDTVTVPTDEMRRVMAEAPVGDDVFGEDPTIRRLEERTAQILGKEAALYVPSGTMANQIALAVLTDDGDEVYCADGAHIFNYEAGAPSMIARIQIHPIPAARGIFTREDVEARLRPKDHHFPPSSVIEIENTSNRGGGAIWPLAEIRRLRELADEHGMRMHLDGARLWNAAVASGTPEREWARHADTVSVCYSKGLGAPVGSAIAGPADLIAEGHRMRKRLGGGMRQAGIVAAGALHALDHHRERLADDHRRARKLAEGLVRIGGFEVDLEHVDTNILMVGLEGRGLEAEIFADSVARKGLLVTMAGRQKVRFVTHLGIEDEDIQRAVEIVEGLYGG